LSALGRLDEAACLFCRSVECDGNNLWAYCDAASTLISLGRDEEGLRYAEAAAALSPTDEEARIALGSALLHLKQYDRAVFHLQAAAELFPSDPLVREHLAYALAAAGRNEEAVTQCEKAVALAPSNVNYRVELRDLFDRLGRTPKALVQAQRAVDLAPACDPYRFDLACLLDQIGNNSDALPHLRQLAVTSSTNLDYRQELTWCQWSLQRYDEALENAQFLVKADPHKAIYWSLRGCALDSKRRLWASQASFQKACELDPATERYRLLWQNERKRCVIADTAIGGLFLSTVLLLLEFIRWWTGKTACQVARGKLN
jgi:Flp pilus assembly protein TadD